MNVFVLATCRLPELYHMTELVFRTIRVGFPTACIRVNTNRMRDQELSLLKATCDPIGCELSPADTIHHLWIEDLVNREVQPFYVVDTDVIFYESVEDWTFTKPLAGWRIPEWNDQFTASVTRTRLHTSLLYIDPTAVREEIRRYYAQFPTTHFNPKANLFHPLCMPFKGRGYFYDTCGMLYHAIGGESFTAKQLDAYFHFNFGTISDIVLPRLKMGDEIARRRKEVLDNPVLGRGLWREQMEYYQSCHV